MKKRIISAILSMATVISTVTALTSNASPDWYWGRLDEEKIAETFGDCTQLEGQDWLETNKNTKYFFLSNENPDSDKVTIFQVYGKPDSISVEFDLNADLEPIKDKIRQLDSSLEVNSFLFEPNKTSLMLHISCEVILPETAKEIREIVGNDIVRFGYEYNRLYYRTIYYDNMTKYPVKFGFYDAETEEYIHVNQEEKILEYAEAHSDIFDVLRTDYNYEGSCISLIPKKEVTKIEHIELAKKIFEETGCRTDSSIPELAYPPLGGVSLDLTDYLNGDANNDSTTTIADAAAVFQSLANPDKYKLSAQGEFNADFACDGITVDDAVKIQKKLAGITE
ncbi:MAG: hypothetical protein IKJ60_04245 [Ruminococcus sp.]|nr:hypothetical protein [Ruminococcus sp.]